MISCFKVWYMLNDKLIYIVTDLTKPLLGNSFVSMFKRATIEECYRC
jgi:hypothetical protein